MVRLYFLFIIFLIIGCSSKEYPQVVEHYNESEYILKGLTMARDIDIAFQYNYNPYFQDTSLSLQGNGRVLVKEDAYYDYEEPEERDLRLIIDSLVQKSSYWMVDIKSLNHPETQEKLAGLSPNLASLLKISLPKKNITMFGDLQYVYWSEMVDIGERRDVLVEYYLIKSTNFQLQDNENIVDEGILPWEKDKKRTLLYNMGRINDSIQYRILN